MDNALFNNLNVVDSRADDAELFRIVAETATDAIVTIDDRNQIIFVNSAAERIFGYAAAEMLGQNITMLMPARFRSFHVDGLNRYLETGKRNIPWKGVEIKGLHKDGTEIPMEISFGATKKNGRNLFTGIIRDITERKRAEEALQKSEERLRMLFDQMTDGFYVTTADGKFVDLNPAMVKMFGYESREEMMQVDIPRALYFAPEERQSHLSEDPQGVSDVYRMRRKDGSVIWVEDKGGYTYDDDGNKVLHHGLIRDVTERVRIEQALRENERVVSTLLSNLPGMAYRCLNDVHWTMKFVSDGCLELTGYAPEELIDNRRISYAELMHPDDSDVAAVVEAAVAAKTPFQLTYRIRTWSGKEKWVWEQGRGVFDANGKLTSIEGLIIDITDRIHAERSLQKAEENYRNLVELSPAIVYLAQPQAPFATLYISPNISLLGYPVDEWYSRPDRWLSAIHEGDRQRVLATAEECRDAGIDSDIEYRVVARDGTVHWFHDKGRFIQNEQGEKIVWQGVLLDITETKRLEEQLRQSQKLESVGRLAGGIAHDFNNMLTAINGYSDLSLRALKEDEPVRRHIQEIKKAGERSAALIGKLLAFSRQQILQPQIIELTSIISETVSLIERIIGEDIKLELRLEHGLTKIKVDPVQFVQVLMNLAVNARDAMPHGGRLTIETARVEIDYDFTKRHIPTQPGSFVVIAVRDTGVGIDEQARQKIFEPFFTSKETGKGTGLGLATVYGIVQQSGGYIVVESEIGQGSTFKIYLPTTDGAEPVNKNERAQSSNGSETILLVEDEETVRAVTKAMIENCGYRVIEARNGVEALQVFSREETKIDLVVTDIIMPEMGGRELAEKLHESYPELPILFVSGYTDDFAFRERVVGAGLNFIQKPYTVEGLTSKIKATLENNRKP